MSRAVIILATRLERAQATRWIQNAPQNTRVEFKQAKRTIPQNARMWAMLTELARQVEWHGVKLSADDWKLVFLDALKSELRMVPNLNGDGIVNLGRSSSDLSKEEFGDLMTLIEAFGARLGVEFHDAEAPAVATAAGAGAST